MTTLPQGKDGAIADAGARNWVDRFAPARLLPYLRLARADRPVGFFLLAFPCFWSVALAARSLDEAYPDLRLLILFAIGALVMRAAGCTYNDIVDRDIDAQVARTRARPIPSGQVSLQNAILFMVALSLIGFAVLLQFNTFTVWLGLGVLPIVALYPFVKRFSSWPQLVLGLAFNWGALLGWTSVLGRLDWAAVVLYAGAVAWTIGYDTIYAHQDRDEDGVLRVEVVDDGEAVDPRAVPEVDLQRYASERRTGGLGMHLMGRIMDSVTFRRAARRNVCCMVKRKPSAGRGATP